MISILITLGAMPEERRGPVLAALSENLGNPGVAEIHVVAEDRIDWIKEAAGDAASRVYVHPVEKRPTFGDLFAIGNRLLEAGAGTIALMNGDISIATSDDVARVLKTFDVLGRASEPVLLALTRHETEGSTPQITLHYANGLPNYISADAWIFQRPIHLNRELFYCPGQMNCDMFLASDLLASGVGLYNPCLDIVVKHHESSKDDAFYRSKLGEDRVQNMLERHVEQNNINPFNYFGVAWTKTEWLENGYHPKPFATNYRRIMLAVPTGREDQIGNHIDRLVLIGLENGFELQILCEGNIDRLIACNIERLKRYPQIVVTKTRDDLATVRESLLSGSQWYFNRLAFASDLSQLTPAVLAEADGLFVGVRELQPMVGPELGCTLVTSVFQSDSFIRGFINNTLGLIGYGALIDHIFLVAKLSPLETKALSGLLDRCPNVMVLWHKTDPGLYACWNTGIRMARRTYVSNANVDDLRDPEQVIALIRDMEMHPEAQVSATAMNPFYVYPEDGSLPTERAAWYSDQAGPFGFFDLARLSDDKPTILVPHNIPHCMPLWRRSLHERYGWFDEAHFGTFADWAFWLKVLQDGSTGWLEARALSFYFVNPASHNRRGTDLDKRHRLVEEEFMPAFLARREGQSTLTTRKLPVIVPKLNMNRRDQHFGEHRNDFNRLVRALDPLDRTDGTGIRLIPFIERYFVWGDEIGEAGSWEPSPITQDWIGILHVPFDAPQWHSPAVSPENFMKGPLWLASRPACRGIITLCADLEADLRAYDPDLRTLSLRHPTETDVPMFNFDAYLARPRVVQVGDWLRKLQAIHTIRAPGHERVMLLKRWTEDFLKNEVAVFGDKRDPAVSMLSMVPNEEYDQFLTSSVVLCMMYATAANNVVVECIARATPLLINPLPGVVEYLGADYPLYAQDEAHADLLLASPARIRAAHLHLLKRRQEIDLTYEGFCRDIAVSEFYARI